MSPEPGRPAPPDPGAAASPAEAERAAPAARPRFLRRRRAEALAAIVPIAAFLALMPPFVWIFAHDGRVFGAPAALVFLMLLWSAMILATRALARRLARRDRKP